MNYLAATAVLSQCGRFRYRLGRVWDAALPVLLFIMLNPSTADGRVDDNTIRKIVGFAQRLGYGGVEVVNLFAYRATKPLDLRAAGFPIGPDNDRHIIDALGAAGGVVCAWGAFARSQPDRVRDVRELITMCSAHEPVALRLSADGTPWHPLYLPNDSLPVSLP